MSISATLIVGPDAGADAAQTALQKAFDTLAADGTLAGQRAVMPPTESGLRQRLAAPPSAVLHMVVEAAAVGGVYLTVRLADAAGAPRSLNVQALGKLVRQAAPDLRLVVLQGFAGARQGPTSPHALVAQALVSAGIEAVVVVSPQSAAATAMALYRSLARGDTIGAAVAAANDAVGGDGATCHGESQRPLIGNPSALVPAANAALADERMAAVAREAEAALASLRMATSQLAANRSAPAPPAKPVDPIAEALRAKRHASTFDVFLCHNSADKPAVKQLGQRLKERGILPWLDEWELPPGQAWQALLEQQIQRIASAAVCIGPAGISPWHQQEMRGFIAEFVERQVPVIPVLLPGAPARPELPLFLKQFTWVDFRQPDPDPMRQLVWGITGRREGED
jgi:hypothetical protein